jgi:hypothetical protein
VQEIPSCGGLWGLFEEKRFMVTSNSIGKLDGKLLDDVEGCTNLGYWMH